MNLQELVLATEQWAKDRHLHTSTPRDQYVKLMEEIGELAADLSKGRDPRDSIGDSLVVLIILCLTLNVSLDECLDMAYNEIKDRRGKLVNGVFIKEADLSEPMYSEVAA